MPATDISKIDNSNVHNTSIGTRNLDDPRFRIRPLQQVASACTGALITACFSKITLLLVYCYSRSNINVIIEYFI